MTVTTGRSNAAGRAVRSLIIVIAALVTIVVARLALAQFESTCGDANGDGEVTVSDGVNALRAAAELSTTCTLETCDVDRDGSITVTDGVNILRRAAGLSADDCTGGSHTTPTPTLAPTITPLPTSTRTVTPIPDPTFTVSDGGFCCRHCTTGIPCGDTCISATKTCHTIGGCACF